MAVTLPITDRDLALVPLSVDEMDAMLAAYVAAAADPVTVKFATGLQSFLGNRHITAKDVAYVVGNPAPLDKDQFGNTSVQIY